MEHTTSPQRINPPASGYAGVIALLQEARAAGIEHPARTRLERLLTSTQGRPPHALDDRHLAAMVVARRQLEQWIRRQSELTGGAN